MGKQTRPRKGSLQFWPRKRSGKIIASVNWNALKKETPGLLGFITYKVGMKSAVVKNTTDNSFTKGSKITIPATVVEAPPMKIFSVRFYKNKKLLKDLIVSKDKELKRRVKLPKELKSDVQKISDEIKDYDDIRVIAYSNVGKTAIKKAPDMAEIGLSGTKEQKLELIKSWIGKEISVSEVFKEGLVDVRGVTKGYGTHGPVKRFGIKLRFHKTEKGRRKVGSIAPWNPSRVTFRTPMAGQTGFHLRLAYNKKIINSGKISEKNINPGEGFKNFGKIKTEYLVLTGSVQGPAKRAALITSPLRPTKKTIKKKYEFIELV